MNITVAVCTYGRPAMLKAALEQMTRLEIPADVEWELIVVNNDGSSETDDVIARCAGRLPIRGLREAVPGLAHARNRAVREASGDYIVWTDDDTLVSEKWIAAYATAFEGAPDAAVFGGSIAARFEEDPPAWISRTTRLLVGPFALRDLQPEPMPIVLGQGLPFGANYAVRATEQRRHLYDVVLGRRPDGFGLGHEESEVVTAILRAGGTGWWVPDAEVLHRVPRARQSLAYVRAYFEAEGEYQHLRALEPVGVGRMTWRAWAAELRFQVNRRLRGPEHWVRDLILASEAWGQLHAARRASASGAARVALQ